MPEYYEELACQKIEALSRMLEALTSASKTELYDKNRDFKDDVNKEMIATVDRLTRVSSFIPKR